MKPSRSARAALAVTEGRRRYPPTARTAPHRRSLCCLSPVMTCLFRRPWTGGSGCGHRLQPPENGLPSRPLAVPLLQDTPTSCSLDAGRVCGMWSRGLLCPPAAAAGAIILARVPAGVGGAGTTFPLRDPDQRQPRAAHRHHGLTHRIPGRATGRLRLCPGACRSATTWQRSWSVLW
jgi:hypothetical protein